MIIVKLKGGLGNQMFQYATGLSAAIKNNVEMKIDITGYSDPRTLNSDTPRTFDLKDFNISSEIASSDEIKRLKYPIGIISKIWRFFKAKVLRKFYLDYHPNILEKKNYYLDGFWQSEKNFLEIKDMILKEFVLKREIDYSIINSKSVSIHIRRGDYVSDKKTNNTHGTPTIEYYKQAYKTIKEKSDIEKVYIFSDDTKWVKENFDFIDLETTYVSDMNFEAAEEIILMSKCSHNIIANSSFSWWGAWLNKNPYKIVIAPKKWLSKGDGGHKNIIPESWIRM